MTKHLHIALVVLLTSASARAFDAGLVGSWEGSTEAMGRSWRLTLEIKGEGRCVTGVEAPGAFKEDDWQIVQSDQRSGRMGRDPR